MSGAGDEAPERGTLERLGRISDARAGLDDEGDEAEAAAGGGAE
jgi:hypothetical protein